jgi:uncharacterized membrane protein YidH (DUF202 family)
LFLDARRAWRLVVGVNPREIWLIAIVLAGVLRVCWAYWRVDRDSGQTHANFRNPFSFWSVIGFALTMGVIILLGRFSINISARLVPLLERRRWGCSTSMR